MIGIGSPPLYIEDIWNSQLTLLLFIILLFLYQALLCGIPPSGIELSSVAI